jgi:hypothetical protein
MIKSDCCNASDYAISVFPSVCVFSWVCLFDGGRDMMGDFEMIDGCNVIVKKERWATL